MQLTICRQMIKLRKPNYWKCWNWIKLFYRTLAHQCRIIIAGAFILFHIIWSLEDIFSLIWNRKLLNFDSEILGPIIYKCFDPGLFQSSSLALWYHEALEANLRRVTLELRPSRIILHFVVVAITMIVTIPLTSLVRFLLSYQLESKALNSDNCSKTEFLMAL